MHTLPHRTQIFTLSIATVALLLASNLATADIYKWRNNRGVIQYSDKPPVSGFTKASQHEIVNSLQSKDMCIEPTAKTAAAAVRKFGANFFARGFLKKDQSTPSVIIPPTSTPVATAPKPIPVVTAPIPTTPKPLWTRIVLKTSGRLKQQMMEQFFLLTFRM